MPEESGGGIRIVDRTNNHMENFFHHMKHGERRRSGRKVLTQDFENIPAAAALVHNLTMPDYVELVCGTLDSLPDAFAKIDAARRTSSRELIPSAKQNIMTETATASISQPDRHFLRTSLLHRRIERDSRCRAPRFILAGK
jgi:hypothetical protein